MRSGLEALRAWLENLLNGEYLKPDDTVATEDEQLQELAQDIHLLSDQLAELKSYSLALARGDLEVDFPPRKNYLAGGLKELHANLLHLTWKVDQIAQGNYGQKVDYMGQISEAFNQMADMLAKRDLQLTQSRNVLEIILSYSDISVFVLERESGQFLHGRENLNNYINLLDMPAATFRIVQQLKEKTTQADNKSEDWELYSEDTKKWYMVKSLPGTWGNSLDAYFHVLTNISETIELSERLQDAMYRDSKFQAYNQTYAIEAIQRLIAEKNPFSVCYFDLDNLKETNDVWGHEAGDRLLQRFIDTISASIRARDVLCRVGGDEFLLLLTNTNYNGAQKIVDRICELTENFNNNEHTAMRLSFSYGIETVATFTVDGLHCCAEPQCKELHCGEPFCIINRADRKMYDQKRLKKARQKQNYSVAE